MRFSHDMRLPTASLLCRTNAAGSRISIAVFAFAATVFAQPRIDNVLERMVPPGSTGLVGAHMDQIKQTEMYKKMVAAQSLLQLDQFARETGFDPRRDVREILFVTTPQGAVMLARGTFHVNPNALKDARQTRHGK